MTIILGTVAPRLPLLRKTSWRSTEVSLSEWNYNACSIFNIGKRECYTFMSVDVGVYLPSYEQCTIYFLKDLMRGKKKSKFHLTIYVDLTTLQRYWPRISGTSACHTTRTCQLRRSRHLLRLSNLILTTTYLIQSNYTRLAENGSAT